MDSIYEYEPKQKLLRLQPGATATSIQSALRLHGTTVPALDEGSAATLGGAIANDSTGPLSGSMGAMRDWVSQLEVILDSGDVLQTGPISKRELSKQLGTPGRVGDIYRGIDTVLEDHKDLIAKLSKSKSHDRSGYPGIAKVRQKSGGIDLTPLIIGSQGTLGVIVEAIVKAEFIPSDPQAVALLFSSAEAARDASDVLAKTSPSILEYYDGRFYQAARAQGKVFAWAGELPDDVGAILWVGYHSFQARTAKKAFKKIEKLAIEHSAIVLTTDEHEYEHMRSLRDLTGYIDAPVGHMDRGAVVLGDGMYVPAERFETFLGGVADIEKWLHIDLPIEGSMLGSIYRLHPTLSMRRVSDKQKILKLLDELQTLLTACDGAMVGAGGEGRLLGRFAHSAWDDEYRSMMDEIKQVFDPYGIFNNHAKRSHDLKVMANFMTDQAAKKR